MALHSYNHNMRDNGFCVELHSVAWDHHTETKLLFVDVKKEMERLRISGKLTSFKDPSCMYVMLSSSPRGHGKHPY